MLRQLSKSGAEVHAVTRVHRNAANVTWHVADLRDPAPGGRDRALGAAVPMSFTMPGTLLQAGSGLTRETSTGRRPASPWSKPVGRSERGSSASAPAPNIPGTKQSSARSAPPIRPASLYGKAKAHVWDRAQTLASAAWGRVFMPYGPGDNAKRLIPSVIAALRAGQPVDLTTGLQERDFVFATDVARFFFHLLASGENGAFNVGTGTALSIRHVVEDVAATLSADPLLLRFGARHDDGESVRIVADMRKSRSLWEDPPISFSARPVIVARRLTCSRGP